MGWEVALALGLGSLFSGTSQIVMSELNRQQQKDAADKQYELQKQQLDAEMAEADRQMQKEENTTAANNASLSNVFGDGTTTKKKKQQSDVFLSDMAGVV